MPLFGGQKKSGSHNVKKGNSSSSSAGSNGTRLNNEQHAKKPSNGTTATPTLPPPSQPQEARHWTQVPPPTPPSSMIPSRQELVFHTQLAHGRATRDVKDFSNVKELYAKIAVVFDIPITDVGPTCVCVCCKYGRERVVGGSRFKASYFEYVYIQTVIGIRVLQSSQLM